jgi:pimeloyl-ACP methyl ester carboxylesterase
MYAWTCEGKRMTKWLLIGIYLLSAPVWADIVELTLPGNLVALAEYRTGETEKPAVILLHGFMQTHEFPLIHRLTDNLNSAGYTVLAPTLTLGISHRKQSLACEAIHTHTQEDAINELDAWVKWLRARKVHSVVLLGHSFGSMQALAYMVERRDPAIKKLIGVSIIEGRMKMPGPENDKLMSEIRAMAAAGGHQTLTRPFSFCQKFRATPQSLLSYLRWNPEKIAREIDRSRLPITFIMGGQDDRLGPGWIDKLAKTRAKVQIIKGANHFMDGEYEFDLNDLVIAELKAR